MRTLRDDPALDFKLLIDICGVDWPARAKRFDVVYHLLSLTKNRRVRVKLRDRRGDAGALHRRGAFPPPTGSSAKPSTCMAWSSPIIRICAAS